MGDHSKIEWTDATWNPIGGCSIKSPGCGPCYAQKLAGTRLKNHPLYAGTTDVVKGKPVFNGKLTVAPGDHPVWTWPVRWRGAKAPKLGAGMPSLIFVGDMSDLYHENRVRAVQDRVVESIVHSRHIGQLLTKRPDVMADHIRSLYAADRWFRELLHPLFRTPNFAAEATFNDAIVPRLWLGTSAERQKELDERLPYLLKLAQLGFIVFISYEPAVGPLVLPADFLALGNRAQVIAGGMSGDEASPAHPDWFRAVRDQCATAGVPFFQKQWGEYHPSAEHDHVKYKCVATPEVIHITGKRAFCPSEQFALIGGRVPGWAGMCRIGKKAAGRLLDGKEWNQFPVIDSSVPHPGLSSPDSNRREATVWLAKDKGLV